MQDSQYYNKLVGEFDAQVWAKEFVKLVKEKPEIVSNEENILAWFANAIMSGYDHANRIQMERDFPNFNEIMSIYNNNKAVYKLLVQAVAMLSVTKNYSHMTPEEVYNKLVEHTKEVYEYIEKMSHE